MTDIQSEIDRTTTIIERLKQDPPDAIVITSGSIVAVVAKRDEDNNYTSTVIEGPDPIYDRDTISSMKGGSSYVRYTTTSFSRKDARGAMAAGKARVLAAAEISDILHGTNPNYRPTIIALSRSTNNFSPYSDAQVAITEYNRKVSDIPHETITDENPIDTFSELLLMLQIGIQRKINNMAVLTTRFQFPRTQAMLQSLLNLQSADDKEQVEQMIAYNQWRIDNRIPEMSQAEKNRLKQAYRTAYEAILQASNLPIVTLVIAEDILKHRSNHHATLINELEDNSEYRLKILQDQLAATSWGHRKEDGTMQYGQISQQYEDLLS